MLAVDRRVACGNQPNAVGGVISECRFTDANEAGLRSTQCDIRAGRKLVHATRRCVHIQCTVRLDALVRYLAEPEER
jgi:hypothetical protein